MTMKQNEPSVLMVVDIGGSKYMPGFLDSEGNILYQESYCWDGVTETAILDQIKKALHKIRKEHPELAERTAAGGLTIPGFADPVTGDWVDSDVPVIRDFPICKLLEEEFHIPFYADNDCNACALAEYWFGGARGKDNFLYLTVSTGIGGALYLNGNLHYGSFYHGGEIGLCVVEQEGRPTDSGSMKGVVEMYGSTRGMRQTFLELGGPSIVEGKEPGGLEISWLARKGDPIALKTIELEGRYLGRAIGNAAALMDCEKVIIGGGISLMFDQYQPWLEEEFDRIQPNRGHIVSPSELGYSGAFLGAGAVALRGMSGFTGSPGSGSKESCVLRVTMEETLRAEILLDGQVYEGSTGNGADFGSFLLSRGLGDPGLPLRELGTWEEATPALLGDGVGRAIACAAVLFDPGRVEVIGDLFTHPDCAQALIQAVKRETYYRGDLPFAVELRGQ